MSIKNKNLELDELNKELTAELENVGVCIIKAKLINIEVKKLRQIYELSEAKIIEIFKENNGEKINESIQKINRSMKTIIPEVDTIPNFSTIFKLDMWLDGKAGTAIGHNNNVYREKVKQYREKAIQIDSVIRKFKIKYLFMRNNTRVSVNVLRTKIKESISDLNDSFKVLNNAVVETTDKKNKAADLQKEVETTSKKLNVFLKKLDDYIEKLDNMPDTIDLIVG